MYFRSYLFILLFLVPAVIITAQTPDIEAALKAADVQAVRSILSSSSGDALVSAEAAVVASARKSVLDGNLDLALSLLETVLMADLDNVEAQDLYTSVEASRQDKLDRAAKKKAADEKKAEDERKKAEDERLAAERAEADRLAKEKAEKEKADEAAFIRSVRHVDLGNFSASVAISPADFLLYTSDFANTYHGDSVVNTAYGFSGAAQVRFSHPYVGSAIEIRYQDHPFEIGSGDARKAFTANLSVGTPALGIPLYLLGGYQWYRFEGSDTADADTVLFTALSGPTLGFAVEEWRLGAHVDVGFDVQWLGASLSDDVIDLGFTLGGSARFKFNELRPSVRPYLEVRAREIYLGANGDCEQAFSASLLAGVLINEYK